jgi:phosphoglucomutase
LDPATVAGLRARLEDPPRLLTNQAIIQINRLDGVKLILEDGSWLLLRPSGTEPVVRLYAEASTERQLEALIAEGQRLIGLTAT